MVDLTIKIYDFTPLIKLSTGEYPRFFPQMRKENPNVSFGNPGNISALQDFGYDYVYPTTPPEVNQYTQKQPEEGYPVQWEDGTWHQVWETRPFTEEELGKNLEDAKNSLREGAYNIYTWDKAKGVKYTLGSQEYTVLTSDAEISLLLSLKSLAEEPENIISKNGGILYKFFDNTIINFTNEDFILMANEVFTLNYQLTLKYWNFLETLRLVSVITDLPELPQTFIE